MPAERGRRRHRILLVAGTRPEAIKMAPVARAVAARPALDAHVVLTGQHEGLAGHFELPSGCIAELGCDVAGRTAPRLREALHATLFRYFRQHRPDLVLVHGDTATAVAGALAAKAGGVPVGHVEAGLRSFDFKQPWPEEGNRVAIDALSDLLFAPTERAADNLRKDWRTKGRIHVTGNSGIDALLAARARLGEVEAPAGERKLILATCHRRENQGAPAAAVCEALKRLVRELPVRIAAPLHPNPHARRAVEEALSGTDHVELMEPLPYPDLVRLMAQCWLIASDSGGFQEEGPALGKPVLVLRNVTERPEALDAGSIELVGTDPDRIFGAIAALLEDEERYARMARPAFPFGDGNASPRIVEAAERWLAERASRAA